MFLDNYVFMQSGTSVTPYFEEPFSNIESCKNRCNNDNTCVGFELTVNPNKCLYLDGVSYPLIQSNGTQRFIWIEKCNDLDVT